MRTIWRRQWNSWVARTRYPGVYRRRDGGHLVRALVTLPNGDRPEIRETYPDTQDDSDANGRLQEVKRELLEAYHRAQEQNEALMLTPPTDESLAMVVPATVDTPPTATAIVAMAPPTVTTIVATSESGRPSQRPVTVQELEAVLERRSKCVTRKSFRDFAREVAAHREANGNNATPASRAKFEDIVNHLVDGTTVRDTKHGDVIIHCDGLGDCQLEDITAAKLREWKLSVSKTLIQTGSYKTSTVNGWVATLKSIMAEATQLYRLPHDEAETLEKFSTDANATYTREKPNALLPVQAYHFMRLFRLVFPQHYAMTFLMLYTGLRPCNIRPLRRRGPSADINWETGKLYVARSQTRGQVTDDQVRSLTKQGTRYFVQLPRPILDVMDWHVKTQLVNGKMLHSELLFPGIHGTFRSPSVLIEPFTAISKRMKLGFRLTPRGLRRTFNDLARRAEVDRSVTRSISGHLTEEMQELYETVGEDETCKAVTKMHALVNNARQAGKRGPKKKTAALPMGTEKLETLVDELSQLLAGLQAQLGARRPDEMSDLFEDDDGDDEADFEPLEESEEPIAAE